MKQGIIAASFTDTSFEKESNLPFVIATQITSIILRIERNEQKVMEREIIFFFIIQGL